MGFFGMVLKPGKKEAVEVPPGWCLQLCTAALEPAKAGVKPRDVSATLWVQVEEGEIGDTSYLLGSLQGGGPCAQIPVGHCLTSVDGEVIMEAKGGGVVHLTGFFNREYDPDIEQEDESSDEEESSEEEEEEGGEEEGSKNDADAEEDEEEEEDEGIGGGSSAKLAAKAKGRPVRSAAAAAALVCGTGDGEDSEDDSEVDGEFVPGEDDDDDDMGEDDDDDDDDDDDEEEEEEEEESTVKQSNGKKRVASAARSSSAAAAAASPSSAQQRPPKKSRQSAAAAAAVTAAAGEGATAGTESTAGGGGAEGQGDANTSEMTKAERRRQRKKENKRKAAEAKKGLEEAFRALDSDDGEPPVGVPLKNPRTKTLKGGLKIKDTVFGGGKMAVPGKNVKICYEGCFPDGRVFDKNNNRRRPLQFRVGMQSVIVGMDRGVEGMRVGGSREIAIPAALGYGARGTGPIPANQDLVFRVELVDVLGK